MKKMVMGVLAHVDSGKTTLSEGLLYLSGAIKKAGRVDHGDTSLDTNEIEKQRGITVFAKPALLNYEDLQLCLLDTPGHVDFGAEAERTLQVLDCAVLIVSSLEGVQNHTVTIWNLLKTYNVPTFIFVNKMDLDGVDKTAIITNLKKEFGAGCIDFSDDNNNLYEEISVFDEKLMEKYFDGKKIEDSEVSNLIFSRQIFPCYFGSALKMDGLQEFLNGVCRFSKAKNYPQDFGAKVFKVSYEDGERVTFLKVTGGQLKVKSPITQKGKNGDSKTEKVNEIRIYVGDKYQNVQELEAGLVCGITGLSNTFSGQGLGFEKTDEISVLQSIFNYKVLFSPEYDEKNILSHLRKLEEEEPQLRVHWDEQSKNITISLMGEIQLEIIKTLFFQRFGIHIDFDAGSVVYRETIAATVEGVGHYEPLRHYAEVHLLMEPGEQGSGLVFDTMCREDRLDINWQRLIMTHLAEKTHIGVLTGSPITDMKITLVDGKAHVKHTEGGDFRQATYRAVRNGLMKAENIILEPWYDFEITVPSENIGRVMTDIQKMSGEFTAPEIDEENSILKGSAPVSEINSYNSTLVNFSRGKGRMVLSFKGYLPCHNWQTVLESIGYDVTSDIDNSPDSIFCKHGAGVVVKWYDVADKMHLPSFFKDEKKQEEEYKVTYIEKSQARSYLTSLEDDKELLQIFEQTYGKIKTDKYLAMKSASKKEETHYVSQAIKYENEYLLVDGYNIIFAWEELNTLSKESLEDARHKLADILCNYRGFKKINLILVFDAYKVKGNVGSIEKYHNINIVYTKEAETADMYIERVTHEISKKNKVIVATSDGLEQIIILGHGAFRISANEFYHEVKQVEAAIKEYLE